MASPKVVVVSGYFNPIHAGHIEYFRLAKQFAGPDGSVMAIVNSDEQSIRKKGSSFIPQEDRLRVVEAIRFVDRAVLSIDQDRTVRQTLKHLCTLEPRPTHFVNGGDVASACAEEGMCEKLGICLAYGLGDKIQSSSWILQRASERAPCSE
jgi:D-beta-D-heptose 7-phosphate kinase/D-beta-D-heptose 1-phosphate adenosyltransferase